MRVKPATLACYLIAEPSVGGAAVVLSKDHPQLALVLILVTIGLAVDAFRRCIQRLRTVRVLLLGSSPLARRLVRELQMHPQPGWRLDWLREDPGADPLAEAARMDRVLRAEPADRIVVGLADRRGRLPARGLLAARARGAKVQTVASLYEEVTGKVPIEALVASDLIFGDGFRAGLAKRAWERGVSILSAVVGLSLLGVMLPFIAAAIKIDSPGPVFFTQQRRGQYGRPFGLVKFRTMRVARGGCSEWERDNRDRVTTVGKWLRRFHLDELPQFWNVLKGDMNLVGPRPHPMSNASLFHDRIPFYSLREAIRPGITGWAQVRYGYANDLAEEIEKMRYDLYYLKNRSPWLDIKCIPETISSTVTGVHARAHEEAEALLAEFAEDGPGHER
jgi:lipopolysaccharide/colanic/teichoic acid biosynthesis glycosyltransferase